jgi:hypothetical protein
MLDWMCLTAFDKQISKTEGGAHLSVRSEIRSNESNSRVITCYQLLICLDRAYSCVILIRV